MTNRDRIDGLRRTEEAQGGCQESGKGKQGQPAIVEVEKNDKETVDCSMRFLRKNRKCKNGV